MPFNVLRSPKQYNSDSDLSKNEETGYTNMRKRGREDDFSEALKTFSTEMMSTLSTWKSELQRDISSIQNNLDSVLKADLGTLNTSISELKLEISSIHQDYQDIKKSVQTLDAKHVVTMEKVIALETSIQFHSDQYENLVKKVDSMTGQSKSVEQLESKIDMLVNENKLLQLELNANNQRDRLLNLEIVGVPEFKNENLSDIVIAIAKHSGVTITPGDILEVNRVSPKIKLQGRPKNIVAKFTSRLVKDNIFSSSRKNRITTKDLGIHGNMKPVYINEHLTRSNKILMKTCRETAKQKQYQYVWTKHGRIYVRKNDTSPAIHITQECDLLKIR